MAFAARNTLRARHGSSRAVLVVCFALLTLVRFCEAQAPDYPMAIDASVFSAPGPSGFRTGTAVSPASHVLGLNERYLTMDGQPWLPVMGEFHFSRVPEAEWETEILKMKASGVQMISTYVFWIHHEESEGSWDWSGQRDLHHFVELCRAHGMYVYVRIGPWAHGEARNGGLPDWLLTKGPTRKNDPEFMGYVDRFYGQIAGQLQGELWKDGGPVVGIQLENEYAKHGKGEGEEYILALKKMAVAHGLDVPFYSVTGWDHAVVPHGAALPVYGGYPDAPWDSSLKPLPPNEVYLYRFDNRVAGNMGAIGVANQKATSSNMPADTPFITGEMGGGIEDTYHRRPVIQADDIAAMFPVMLGSGVNLYGSYMYHGGQNPEGKLSTLEESQATHYPNDLPVSSYDFQAPIGEYGEERESLRKLKVVNYFLNDFGAELAPMMAYAPGVRPRSADDFSVARVAARSDGRRAFVFANNYVRGSQMPARTAFQVAVKLKDQTVTIPAKPVDIPSNAYFIWPLNLDIAGVTLRYSTAQLFTRLTVDGKPAFVFFCVPGIRCELAFDQTFGAEVSTGSLHVTRERGYTLVTNITGGFDSIVTLHRNGQVTARVIVLSATQAEDAWKVQLAGEEHLLITPDAFYQDGRHIELESDGKPKFDFAILPALHQTLSTGTRIRALTSSPFVTTYEASVPPVDLKLSMLEEKKPGLVSYPEQSSTHVGRSRAALSPEEGDWAEAATWKLSFAPQGDLSNLAGAFLQVSYTGDIAQLRSGKLLLADNFYNGSFWHIGLKRYDAIAQGQPLQLRILPLPVKSPIFLEPNVRERLPAEGQVCALNSVQLVPQYRLQITVAASGNY